MGEAVRLEAVEATPVLPILCRKSHAPGSILHLLRQMTLSLVPIGYRRLANQDAYDSLIVADGQCDLVAERR